MAFFFDLLINPSIIDCGVFIIPRFLLSYKQQVAISYKFVSRWSWSHSWSTSLSILWYGSYHLCSRPRFIHVIHILELFIVSRTLSTWLKVVHIIHNYELFMKSRALSSWPRVVHVTHNPQLVIVRRALSSTYRFVHVIHSLEMIVTFRALSTRPRVVHVVHSCELFMASTTMSCSWHPQSWAIYGI